MDIFNLTVGLTSGAVAGNTVGEALKHLTLGTLGDSLAGILGAGIGAAMLKSLGVAIGSSSDILDAASLISNIVSCSIGGALMMVIIGLIKFAIVRTCDMVYRRSEKW